MEVTKQSRTRLRLQNYAFVILFLTVIGLLAWLSHHYSYEADWTATGRNVLSEASKNLCLLRGPIAPLRQTIVSSSPTRNSTRTSSSS